MKLLQNLLIISFLGLMFACAGGGEEQKKEDTTEVKKEEEEVKKEEPKDTIKFVLTDEAKPFAKKWNLDSYTHTDGKSEKNIKGASLDLKADGTFEETFNNKVITTGKWLVSDKGKTLTLKRESGEFQGTDEKFAVKEVSADKLTTIDDDGKMTEIYITEKK